MLSIRSKSSVLMLKIKSGRHSELRNQFEFLFARNVNALTSFGSVSSNEQPTAYFLKMWFRIISGLSRHFRNRLCVYE